MEIVKLQPKAKLLPFNLMVLKQITNYQTVLKMMPNL